jgi:hypothetical protein
MGWGSGSGKAEVLNQAVGDPIVAFSSSDDHPFNGKLVFIDVSGLAHKASKKDPATVVREGTSRAQQDYLRKQIASVAAEGGTPVLVLDGRAYPPKLATRAARREAAEAARVEAERLQQLGHRDEARKQWAKAAGPQEPFWLALLEECLRDKILFVIAPYDEGGDDEPLSDAGSIELSPLQPRQLDPASSLSPMPPSNLAPPSRPSRLYVSPLAGSPFSASQGREKRPAPSQDRQTPASQRSLRF